MTQACIKKIVSNIENLQRVFDNLKEGIIAHDLNRRIFVFNREAERITGYKKDEVLGGDCHNVFGAPLCGEKCSFCGNDPFCHENIQYSINVISKNGDARQVEMSVTRMDDEAGNAFGVLASLKDVTEIIDLKLRADKLMAFSNIIGHDSKMLHVFQQIRDVAGYDYSVHIFGETGTGKELVAAAIHNESPRAGKEFVPINCGALPEGLIESELFGHVKGSFSGAIRDKKGRFEIADGGTIFLDEVAELSKYIQVKLLRVIQEGKFERVGGEKTVSVNVRIISATNKPLKQEVSKDNFREDLYYRLNVIPMNLPSLRERKNDIPLLINHFLNQAAEIYPDVSLKISEGAMSILMDYQWPGNVRELRNMVQFGIVKSGGREIMPEHLPMEMRQETQFNVKRGPSKKLDINLVKSAMSQAGRNKSKAAKLLGVGRATLYRFLNDHKDL